MPTDRPATGADDPPVGSGRSRRTVAVVAAELAEVRRHLVDAPPHHGAGTRAALHDRLTSLERELAGARSAGDEERR